MTPVDGCIPSSHLHGVSEMFLPIGDPTSGTMTILSASQFYIDCLAVTKLYIEVFFLATTDGPKFSYSAGPLTVSN
jgi:hypothetical protein